MEPIIPDGWRLLQIGEITRLGDRYFDGTTNWGICIATLGRLVQDRGIEFDCFIRQETKPAKEKEWLNAWD